MPELVQTSNERPKSELTANIEVIGKLLSHSHQNAEAKQLHYAAKREVHAGYAHMLNHGLLNLLVPLS